MFRYPDPTPTLVQLQGFSVKKTPVWATTVPIAISGTETQILTQAFPLWAFELTYELLRTKTQNITPDTQWRNFVEYEQIAVLFLACKGQYGRFFFQDPSDCSRAGQLIGIGNGVWTDFRLVRTFGYGSLAFTEPVGAIDLSQTITVYLDGVVAAGWSILDDLQTIQFTSAPGADVQITIDFHYLFYCRFLEDVVDFEEFMNDLHTLRSLRFRSTKDCRSDAPNPYFLMF